MSKPLRKYISSFFVLTVAAIFISSAIKTNAKEVWCDPAEELYGGIGDVFKKDIRNTAMNYSTSVATDFVFTVSTGSSWDGVMGCSTYVSGIIAAEPTDDNQAMIDSLQSGECAETEEAVCETLINKYDVTGTKTAHNRNYSQGSLLGLAYSIQNTVTREPTPVNMAYFFRDYAKRLPIVGERVLAADDSIDYQHTLIAAILDIWKMTTAVAYGLMSIILVYVGITIIMRKQVNQKVVVTVQYSLPKVLMALVLIAFSYPLGALITSLSWSLWNSAPDIWNSLNELVGGVDLGSAQAIGFGGLVILLIVSLASATAFGLGVVIILAILIITAIVLYLIAVFKALMLYIKMLIAIVTAPLEFAVGAIPGNEDKITGWFKRMVAYGISIFAINSTIVLVGIFGLQVIATSLSENAFVGSLFAIFGYVFIFIFGYAFAGQVPTHVQNAIMGKPQTRR